VLVAVNQSAQLAIDAADLSDGATVRQWLVREPDGDQCVAGRLAGITIPPGRRLTASYPEDFQLAPDDNPDQGDNRCGTALEGTYGIDVSAAAGFARVVTVDRFIDRFDVSAERR